MTTKYPIGSYLRQAGALLNISPERVLRRAGLSTTLVNDNEIVVAAETYLNLWDALCLEAGRPGVEMDLAMAYAHGPFIPAVFAFSCAETLGLGLSRLSDFKPLIGPFKMDVTHTEQQLTVSICPSDPGLSMSASMGLFELLYITECARTFTGTSVSPTAASLPGPHRLDAASINYLGKRPKVGQVVSLTFSKEDARLPLITRSSSLWETLEPDFTEQLEDRTGTATMSGRIKHALAETLPGGSTSVEGMARRLNISKRSLQRRLSEEGTSFQELLNEISLRDV